MYPFALRDNVVPASDGAGEVVAVGSRVTRFSVGDKVATLFNQGHIAGSLNLQSAGTGLGGALDGALRQYGAFDQEGLVHVPKNLNWLEASTLSCAAVTAWNGLYGLEGRGLKQGDWVITQGTGGVSMFALQVRVESPALSLSPLTTMHSSPKPPARGSSRPRRRRPRPTSSSSWARTTSSTTRRRATGARRPRS